MINLNFCTKNKLSTYRKTTLILINSIHFSGNPKNTNADQVYYNFLTLSEKKQLTNLQK